MANNAQEPTGRFVAFGKQGLRMASSNGEDWSEPILEKENYIFNSGAFGNNKFVLMVDWGGDTLFFESPDGMDWEQSAKTKVDGRLLDLVYGGGRFLAIGGNTDGHFTEVTTSEDGTTWTRPIKFDKEPLLMRATYGRDRFVAVGYRGRVAVSETGERWQDAQPLQDLDTFISIAYGNGLYVGGGLHGLRMFSEDGLKWQGRVVGEEGEHINSVLWTGKQFVGVGLGATYLSIDGRKWERIPNQDAPVRCTYGGGIFVGTKWKGRVLTSSDGIDWTETVKATEHANGVCFGSV